jgi:hypothetical protein
LDLSAKALRRYTVIELGVFAVLPLPFIGLPSWGASLLPEDLTKLWWAVAGLIGIFLLWVLGFWLGGRDKPLLADELPEPWEDLAEYSWPEMMAIVAWCCFELGAILMVVLSFYVGDARFSMIGSPVALLFLLLTPARRTGPASRA